MKRFKPCLLHFCWETGMDVRSYTEKISNLDVLQLVWDQIYIWQEQIHIQVSAHAYTIHCSYATTWSIPYLGIFFLTALWQNILTHVKPHFLIKILNRLQSAISNSCYLVLVMERVLKWSKVVWVFQQEKLFHLAVTFKGCCLFVSWSKTYIRIWFLSLL